MDLPYQWAVEGKEDGSGEDYRILRAGDGWLTRRELDRLRRRFATSQEDVPRVTVASYTREEGGVPVSYVVVALERWTQFQDLGRRPITYTHWFCLPYGKLRDERLGYRELLRGLCLRQAPETAGMWLEEPSPAVAPTSYHLRVAALLLDGARVCVTGASHLSWQDRLAFIDTVVALMPYGLRADFAATTWVSEAEHAEFRLFFAGFRHTDAVNIGWAASPELPAEPESLSVRFFRLAEQIPPDRLSGAMSDATGELTGAQAGQAALALVGGRPAQPIVEPTVNPTVREPATVVHARPRAGKKRSWTSAALTAALVMTAGGAAWEAVPAPQPPGQVAAPATDMIIIRRPSDTWAKFTAMFLAEALGRRGHPATAASELPGAPFSGNGSALDIGYDVEMDDTRKRSQLPGPAMRFRLPIVRGDELIYRTGTDPAQSLKNLQGGGVTVLFDQDPSEQLISALDEVIDFKTSVLPSDQFRKQIDIRQAEAAVISSWTIPAGYQKVEVANMTYAQLCLDASVQPADDVRTILDEAVRGLTTENIRTSLRHGQSDAELQVAARRLLDDLGFTAR
ncbi:hypothetical protein [Herbidospora sp. RD11066]